MDENETNDTNNGTNNVSNDPKLTVMFVSSNTAIEPSTPTTTTTTATANTNATATAATTPHGTTKAAMGELLLNDYHRKGYIDGRGVRIPSTIIIRPNHQKVTNNCICSYMVSEVLAGRNVTTSTTNINTTSTNPSHHQPQHVKLKNIPQTIIGYNNLISNIIAIHDVHSNIVTQILGNEDRIIHLPTSTLTLKHLYDAILKMIPIKFHTLLGTVDYLEEDHDDDNDESHTNKDEHESNQQQLKDDITSTTNMNDDTNIMDHDTTQTSILKTIPTNPNLNNILIKKSIQLGSIVPSTNLNNAALALVETVHKRMNNNV